MSPAPRRLQGLVDAVRRHLTRRALVAVLLWTVVAAAGVLAAAWLLAGPEGWRQGSGVPLVLDVVLVVVATALLVAGHRGARRWFAEEPLSSAMERASGVRPGVVRGSLELSRAVPAGVSESLVALAAERTLEELNRPVPELSGELGSAVRSWTRRGSGALATTAVILTVMAVAAPTRAGRAWLGLSTPVRLMAKPLLAPLSVTPGSIEVMRGSDVDVRVEAPGRTSADLAWQAAGDVARTETLTLADGVGTRRFEAVSATIEYRVRTPDGVLSEPYRIVPVDPLFVSDLRVEVTYPGHTGLEPEEYRGQIPPLFLPVGTQLSFEGSASRPLSRAVLSDSAEAPMLEATVEGARFEGAWTPRAGGRFTWDFRDANGATAVAQPDPLDLTLVPDSAPVVTIPIPGRDTILPVTLQQPLILEAHDDYGLRRLELVAYRRTATGENRPPLTQGLDLGGTRAALARPMLDVSGWRLLPGDEVHYFARAVDNAPAGHTAETREFVLRMPNAAELRRGAEEQLDSMASRLQELAKEAEKKAEETRDLERQAAADRQEASQSPGRPDQQGQLDYEHREELRKALEDQKDLTGRVDSMRAELEALEETMREAGQADPELRKDLEELQELLQQVAGEDLQQQLDKMAEGLDQEDVRQSNQQLQDLAKQQEEFRDRLEESLERFRRAAVEQDFRATRGEADDLAKQEQALADAMKEEDKPELRAEQQAKLQDRGEELQSRMEKLQERLEQLGEKDAAREVQEARKQAEQAGEQMSKAKEDAARQRPQDAGKKADQAAQDMEKAAEQLDQAQQEMQQQKAEAMQQALHQAADDALSLARRQAELREQMQSAAQDEVTNMRGDEASLVQGVRNLAQSLMERTEGAANGDRELSAQMGRAMESLERTIQAMENRRGSAQSPQAAAERAVDDLNQLALMAMAGAEQMGQQGEGQSGDQVSEQLEQLAQEQGELSNQTGQLTPMQLGEQALREQLQQLAEQQQSVAQDLDQLSEQKGAEEKSLGSLQDLAAEAEAIAKQMAAGRLTPDMTERQERLFHRLLDAGRSLQKDDEETSDERESKSAGAFERGASRAAGRGRPRRAALRDARRRAAPGTPAGRPPARDPVLRAAQSQPVRRTERGTPARRRPVRRILTAACAALALSVTLARPVEGQGVEETRLLREAAARESRGDLDGAERVLRRLLVASPASSGGLFALERVLRTKGEPRAILPAVDTFLAHDPSASGVRYLKLRVLSDLDSLDAVREEGEQWLGEQASSEASYREVARIYERAFGADRALDVLRRGRSALHREDAYALEIGDLLVTSGDVDGAVSRMGAGRSGEGRGRADDHPPHRRAAGRQPRGRSDLGLGRGRLARSAGRADGREHRPRASHRGPGARALSPRRERPR